MKIWILAKKGREKNYQNKRFVEEAENLNMKVKVVLAEEFEISEPYKVDGRIMYKNRYIKLPDAVLTRQTGMTYFGFALLRHLERRGVKVCNTQASIENAEDKLLTTQLLSYNDIPIPRSILAKLNTDGEYVGNELGFPVVLKSVLGSKGSGVFLLKSREHFDDALSLFHKVAESKQNLIIQEYIQESHGKDIRVFVVGDKAIAAVIREAGSDTEFRANVALGGSARKFEVDEQLAEIAVSCAKALGLDIAGIDLLFGKDGYKVCEVNSSPSFDGFEQDTGVNVPRIILEYLRDSSN